MRRGLTVPHFFLNKQMSVPAQVRAKTRRGEINVDEIPYIRVNLNLFQPSLHHFSLPSVYI